MLEWLYRYILRGIVVLFAIGMITLLFLWVKSQKHCSSTKRTAPVHPAMEQGLRK